MLFPARVALAVLCLGGWSPAPAVVIQSQEEALAEAFPDASIERRTVFLDEDQARTVRESAGTDPPSRVVTYYRGVRDGVMVGTAYFDTHRVRTLPEVLMVVVSPQGEVARVSVLSFLEPTDYLPRERWFEQFEGRSLDEGLSLKRDIRGITGATLSSRAATDAVRRVLSLHRILSETVSEGDPPPGETEDSRP